MRMASLMVRFMRRRYQAKVAAGPFPYKTEEQFQSRVRSFVANSRYKWLLEQITELMFEVQEGKDRCL